MMDVEDLIGSSPSIMYPENKSALIWFRESVVSSYILIVGHRKQPCAKVKESHVGRAA